MMQDRFLEKRVTQIRLLVWSGCGLLAFCCFRFTWPLAWQTAAFGAIFTLLWPLVGKEKKKRRKGEEETEEEKSEDNQPAICNRQSVIEIGLDLLVTTLLIGVSGGFGSPFAPLVFGVVLEAFILLGRAAALQMACFTALLNLAHFRSGVTPTAAILYGSALGMLCAAMLTAKMAQLREAETNLPVRSVGLMRPPDADDMQAQLDAAQKAHEEIKDKYRAVVTLNRDQKAQMARMRAVEQLCEMAGEPLMEDAEGRTALGRVLQLVMKLTGADGGVLWLRERGGNVLTVQAAEGRMAASLAADVVPRVNALTPDAIRSHCETALLNATPAALPTRSRLDTLLGAENTEDAAETADTLSSYAIVAQQLSYTPDASGLSGKIPREADEFDLLQPEPSARPASIRHGSTPANPGLAGVTLLRALPTSAEPMGQIIGAIGVCDPRGRQRFLSSELEKVSSLCRALTAAVSSICERADAQKRVREITLLQELQRMAQATHAAKNNFNFYATRNSDNEILDAEQAAARIVETVMELAPCENCTLYLLDARAQRLEPKATRGQGINLLEHIRFERGYGVSGWVASRGRLLHIPDLTQETNLRDVEMMPSQARSFLALPLRIEHTILGVLNVSHARAHAFTPHHIRLLTELAEHAALLLEHATPLQVA